MPARKSWPVAYLVDDTSQPPYRYEAVTATTHALAFRLAATYDPAMRNHALPGSVVATSWWAIPHGAPPDAVPALVTYERGQPRGHQFAVHGQQYGQLGEAMDAAVGA